MVTIPMADDRGGEELVAVPEPVLQELATLCLTGRAFRDLMQTGTLRDLDMMRYKWKRWLTAMREAQRGAEASGAAPDTAWVDRARARKDAGASWRELSREFGKPVSTLRRKLAA